MLGVNMATRIENILTRARDTLADPTAERWTDARLLRLLDEAHKDLAKQTKILKSLYTLPLQVGVYNYALPDNLWLITRAAYADAVIPLVSYDTMDLRTSSDGATHTWQLDEDSVVTALVYDNRNVNEIRTYPIPNADSGDAYTFASSGDTEFVGDELLGVVTAIDDYTFDTPFGMVSELFEPGIITETGDIYGVTTSIAELAPVSLWYIRIPDELTAVTDSLETPTMFDVALKHYIVGHAFRDDLDVQYREMGAESIRLYNRELEVAAETNRTDSTRNAATFISHYRGGFE